MIKKLSLTLGITTLIILAFSTLKETNKREVAGFRSPAIQNYEKPKMSNFEKVLSFSPKAHVMIQKTKFELEETTL